MKTNLNYSYLLSPFFAAPRFIKLPKSHKHLISCSFHRAMWLVLRWSWLRGIFQPASTARLRLCHEDLRGRLYGAAPADCQVGDFRLTAVALCEVTSKLPVLLAFVYATRIYEGDLQTTRWLTVDWQLWRGIRCGDIQSASTACTRFCHKDLSLR